MITSLTAEQEKQIPAHVKKWIDIGLSTDSIDVEKSLEALRKLYDVIGVQFPDQYEIYRSPFEVITALQAKYGITVSASDFSFGVHDASWLAYYDFFHTVCGLEHDHQMDPLVQLATHCGWVLTFNELVVLTEKPVSIHMDAQNRTHCEDDFAIKFRDGTGVAIWHGLRIPSEWIFHKEDMKAEEIVRWSNVEQRRAGCEIMGWSKILDALNSKVIDTDDDPTIGMLVEVDLPDSGKERFLVAMDPNVEKQVCLPVPPSVRTALEANSWTYGIDAYEFKPDLRV